ncbi:MAG: BON domain-containing protein [Firmicutes bacterium]|nr:BON domain-containing protein [Bacillota bacterium]
MFSKRMKLVFCLLVSLLSAGNALAVQTVPAMLTVVTGESRILATSEVSRVAVGDERIADIIVVSPAEVIVNGKQPGVTSLHVWEKTGRREFVVKVYVDNSTLAAEIAEAIGDPRISVRVLRQTVFLEGTVDTAFAGQRAERIAEAYEAKVVNLLQVVTPLDEPAEPTTSPEPAEVKPGLDQVARDLTAYLQNPQIRAQVYGQGILVEGRVASEAEAARIKAVAEFFGRQAGCDVSVITTLAPQRGPQIALQVHVLELASDYLETLGFNWGRLLQGGVVPYEILFSQLTLDGPLERISPLALRLEALVREGDARVLAAPSLVTNSGVQANFLAGGGIPIIMPTNGQLTIEYKDYGVQLTMLPVVMEDGKINLQVAPEVSALDDSTGINLDGWWIPGLKTRRARTEVDLRSGETLIIGGLISNEQIKLVQKVPILGDIPILGQLFRSTSFSEGKTQLVIMVTPEIISAESSPGLEYHLPGELHPEVEPVFPAIQNPLFPRAEKRSEKVDRAEN